MILEQITNKSSTHEEENKLPGAYVHKLDVSSKVIQSDSSMGPNVNL